MADPKTEAKPILKRCGEKVIKARIANTSGDVGFIFGGSAILVAPGAKGVDGRKVDAMALHPAGLAVLYQGQRIVIPTINVVASWIAEDEP